MIDMINLYQSYKQQKIIKEKWIYKYYSLADFIIKTKLLLDLKTLINNN